MRKTEVGHPEDFCGRCDGPNLKTWHAPSPLWNTVMRDAEGYESFDGIVCPRCFGELAREAGVADDFCLTTHDPKVPLPTVFGDGRVWDSTTCMWVEREARPLSAPLEAYEAVVSALEAVLLDCGDGRCNKPSHDEARIALRRLRDEVPV